MSLPSISSNSSMQHLNLNSNYDLNNNFDLDSLQDIDLSNVDVVPNICDVYVFNALLPNAAAFYNNKNTQYHNITKEVGKTTTTNIRTNDLTRQQSETAQELCFEPDMTSIMTVTEKEIVTTNGSETRTVGEWRGGGQHPVHTLNALGYIPGISTVTGLYRTLVGLAFLVKSAIGTIFDSENAIKHKEGMKIASANIVRGFFEMIPVIGNLFVLNLDLSRMTHRWSDFNKVSYGDRHTIPAFQFVENLDGIACIPVLGTITNVLRITFFFFHALVNIPGLVCNDRSAEAIRFSCRQIGFGLLEVIPIVGNLMACLVQCDRAISRIES